MSVRVEVVTPCIHGEWNPHRSGVGEIIATSDGAEIMAVICRGASRKAFTEWPPEAINAMFTFLRREVIHLPILREDAEGAASILWDRITGGENG